MPLPNAPRLPGRPPVNATNSWVIRHARDLIGYDNYMIEEWLDGATTTDDADDDNDDDDDHEITMEGEGSSSGSSSSTGKSFSNPITDKRGMSDDDPSSSSWAVGDHPAGDVEDYDPDCVVFSPETLIEALEEAAAGMEIFQPQPRSRRHNRLRTIKEASSPPRAQNSSGPSTEETRVVLYRRPTPSMSSLGLTTTTQLGTRGGRPITMYSPRAWPWTFHMPLFSNSNGVIIERCVSPFPRMRFAPAVPRSPTFVHVDDGAHVASRAQLVRPGQEEEDSSPEKCEVLSSPTSLGSDIGAGGKDMGGPTGGLKIVRPVPRRVKGPSSSSSVVAVRSRKPRCARMESSDGDAAASVEKGDEREREHEHERVEAPDATVGGELVK